MVNNIYKNLENKENILVQSVTEELQRIFPDKFFIVGEQNIKVDEEGKQKIDFKHKNGILACFQNQWEIIESRLKENNPSLLEQVKNNLTIIDLGILRSGKNNILFGKEIGKNENLRLISGGSMNLLTSKKGYKHLILTTRDGGNVDESGLTGVAGRLESADLAKESEKEFVEEGSYLGYINGELYIIIPSVLSPKDSLKSFVERFIEGLKRNALDNSKSTLSYLEEKYKPEDEKLAKIFNRNFKDKVGDLDYKNLGKKLEEALSKGNVLLYNFKKNKSKYNSSINIGGKNYEGFTYNDEKNNTTEFRKVYDIDLKDLVSLKGEQINDEVSYVGRLARPSNIYLESENQEPRTINLSSNEVSDLVRKIPEKIFNRLVPATKEFVKQSLEK